MNGARAAARVASGPETILQPPLFLRRLCLERAPVGPAAAALGESLVMHRGDVEPSVLARLGTMQAAVGVDASIDEIAATLAAAGLPRARTLIDLRWLGSAILEEDASISSLPSSALRATIGVFRAARALMTMQHDIARVVLATDLGANLGIGPAAQPIAQIAAAGAASGAWKSVAREWTDDGEIPFTLRIVDLPCGVGAAGWDALALEVGRDGPIEVACDGGAPRTLVLRDTRGSESAPTRLELGPESVFLITGGARGVVARIAREVAHRYRCKLVLVGRSARATIGERITLSSARKQARQSLGANASSREVSEAAERLVREHEVAASIAELEALGAEVAYVEGDIATPTVIDTALRTATERFGRVDVVLHGAGIDRSRKLAAKNEEEIAAVLRPKLAAAALFALAPDALPVAIGSVSGRFGNSGQLDYCAANDALAKVTIAAGGLVIDYTAWEEVGMAAPLARVMREQGVDTLRPELAARATVDLIARGDRGEWIMSGRLPQPASSRDDVLAGSVVADIPGAHLVRSTTLELGRLAFLRDHRPTAAGVLPTVVGLQGMIDAATRLEPSLPVREVRDLEIQTALKVFEDKPVEARVEAARRDTQSDALICDVRITSAGPDALHHRATVVLGGPKLQPEPEPATPDLADGPDAAEVYRIFFHGPSFQVLAGTELGDKIVRARSVPLNDELGLDLPERSRRLAMARELVLQSAGVYLMTNERELALPIGLEQLTLTDAPLPGERVEVVARFSGTAGEDLFTFDAWLHGEDGRPLEQYRTLTFRHLASL